MALYSDAELTRLPPGTLHPKPVPELGAPVVLPPVADAGMDVPNVLVPVPDAGIKANHGRIGYVSYTQTAVTSVTSGADTAQALATVSTWERWQPAGGTQSVTFDFGAARTVDYVGLSGYDLAGATVTVATSPDTVSGFTTRATFTDFSRQSVMALFAAVSARRVRVTVTRTVAPALGVVYCGPVLALERASRGGSKPAPLNRKTGYSNEFSAAGNILGRVINRQGNETQVSLSNLTDAWYRANFDPFVQAARTSPFFYLWNPRDYPQDCIYGVASDDIAPTLQGGRKLMDVSFDIEGLA
jgi:hypothetical protein